jgi:hypothetical protein
MCDGCPVFLPKSFWDYIQGHLLKYNNNPKLHQRIVSEIDEQTGGKHPYNYTR